MRKRLILVVLGVLWGVTCAYAKDVKSSSTRKEIRRLISAFERAYRKGQSKKMLFELMTPPVTPGEKADRGIWYNGADGHGGYGGPTLFGTNTGSAVPISYHVLRIRPIGKGAFAVRIDEKINYWATAPYHGVRHIRAVVKRCKGRFLIDRYQLIDNGEIDPDKYGGFFSIAGNAKDGYWPGTRR